ncbi:NAD(P)/FAD-dependent oxidoreductase [Radicibacter daui]|uniref:NAD(P)/FAD-dependent oxidoreductase n=1 Tax=Radicibacter daui TaxID=3064829 RepID=UPI004046F75B
MEDLGTRELVIAGGGLVGMAVGVGALSLGASVLAFDAGDTSLRASRGNFGLIWGQSKGARGRDYAAWTQRAIAAWPAFQDEIRELTGIDTGLRTGAGLHLCLSEEEFDARSRLIQKIAGYGFPDNDARMIRRDEVRSLLPGIGPDVVGASFSTQDGDCHSLALYRGLAEAYSRLGGALKTAQPVLGITPSGSGYRVTTPEFSVWSPRVLIAAGLGTNALARPFGFPDVVIGQRGQILVTERLQPFLDVVTSGLRQLPEGTVLIGDTKEEGEHDRATSSGISYLARRAARAFPAIAHARVVRAWAALRVLTPDGDPVYDESPTHPGIFVASTHSGVTLASAHRGPLAHWLMGGQRPPEFAAFSARRFT